MEAIPGVRVYLRESQTNLCGYFRERSSGKAIPTEVPNEKKSLARRPQRSQRVDQSKKKNSIWHSLGDLDVSSSPAMG
jgi:hypothetical protein